MCTFVMLLSFLSPWGGTSDVGVGDGGDGRGSERGGARAFLVSQRRRVQQQLVSHGNARIREDRLAVQPLDHPFPQPPSSLSSPTDCTKKAIRRFPSALIIGARKGGTRALIDMLKSHPDIVTAVSELHYFDRDENFQRGVQWYIDQMPLSSSRQTTIEKSPSYFVSEWAAHRIHNMSPGIKLILIVRNPLDRTISDYTQLLRKGRNRGSFEGELFLPSGEINSAFYPITVSTYDVHFQKWLKYFDLDQIHVVDGDALIRSPASELQRVERFLEVESYFTEDLFYFNATKGFYCWRKHNEKNHLIPVCLGSAKGHSHPQLSNDTVHRLLEFFQPHNEQFFAQIHRRLDWDTKYDNIAARSKF